MPPVRTDRRSMIWVKRDWRGKIYSPPYILALHLETSMHLVVDPNVRMQKLLTFGVATFLGSQWQKNREILLAWTWAWRHLKHCHFYVRIIFGKSSQSTANGCRQNVLKSVFPTSLDSQSWFSDLIRDEIWIVELQSGNAFSPGEMTQVKKKMGKFRLEATPRTYNLVCDS